MPTQFSHERARRQGLLTDPCSPSCPPLEPDWVGEACPGGLPWDSCMADDCGVDDQGAGCVLMPTGQLVPWPWP